MGNKSQATKIRACMDHSGRESDPPLTKSDTSSTSRNPSCPAPWRYPVINVFIALVLVLGLTACGSGSMRVKEVFYYRVANHTNANYFRLTVDAHTKLGVSELRAGWFPARSVDSLFGDVSSGSGVEALKTRVEAEKFINKKVLEATTNYVNAAIQTNAIDLAPYNRARMQALLYYDSPPPEGFKIMDYDPLAGLVTEHADEKFVMVLSSNPDEVVGKIANFTETDETVLSIHKLTGAMTGNEPEDILQKSTQLATVNSEMTGIYHELQSAAKLTDSQSLSNRIASILQQIKSIKP